MNYPGHLNKHEYVFRYTTPGVDAERIGCHFINRLSRENKNKYFPMYCGFIILEGEGRYTDWNGRNYSLSPGSFVQHIPGKYHVVRRETSRWLEASFTLGLSHYQACLDMGFINDQNPVLDNCVSPQLILAFETLHNSLKQDSVESKRKWLIQGISILTTILDNASKKAKVENLKITKACQQLETDMDKHVDLRQLAVMCHMSYSHFCYEFKRIIGMAPGQYRLKSRMDYAQQLLLESELSINEIAAQLGYADQFIFSKQFKSQVGFSPSEYRQKG